MNVFKEHSTNRLPQILRLFMGKGSAWTVEMVSEITGIGTSTIYHHMSDTGNKPNSDHILAYIGLFGAEFLNLWTQAVGITGAHRPKAVEGEKFLVTLETQHVVGGCLNDLLTWTADGKIDHIEDRLVPKALIASATHMLAVAANYQELRA